MKLEVWDISKLKEDPLNARKHGKRNKDSIRSSLKRFGQVEPLVVKADGTVIGGNGRLNELRAMGEKKVSVTVFDGNEKEARALGVALNRTAELAEWDTSGLSDFVASISIDGDITKGIDKVADMGILQYSHTKLSKIAGSNVENFSDGDVEPQMGDMRYAVIVSFDNEMEQADLLKEMTDRGHDCKLMMS